MAPYKALFRANLRRGQKRLRRSRELLFIITDFRRVFNEKTKDLDEMQEMSDREKTAGHRANPKKPLPEAQFAVQ
ncbi:MAG: hypothetical protein ACI4OL_04545 [Gemmiger sp.]